MTTKDARNSETRYTELKRYVWALVAAWTVFVAILMVLEANHVRQVTHDLAINEARAHFERDQAFRFWATAHGGLYVPIDDRTPPNPHLAQVFERDLETPSGKQLTLMNPAYAIRQMNEEFNELYGVVGHITSLNPLRPENAADDWEREALEAFEIGETEVREFTEVGSEPHLRLMQPMLTQEGCLKCHAHQGYQVGDVRGGVSVSVPLEPYLTKERQTITTHTLSLGTLWVMGLVGIGLGTQGLGRRIQERDQAQLALQKAHDSLDEQVRERTAELRETNNSLEVEISERARAEEALRVYSERLEEMVAERTRELQDAQERILHHERLAALGELAGSVSHELRNPLGVISNAHYMLKMTLTGSDETTQETLDIIGNAVDQSEKIISDLLGFARVKSVDRQIITAESLVQRAIAASTIPDNVAVQVETPANLPPLFVDPQQMGQVLVNLVTNAYQAMPEGGKLTIAAGANQDDLEISIADTGTGIPVENMDKLFEPLFTTKARGIGLGLAISKNLAEANGGSIDVESVEDEGSTFSLLLPVMADPIDE
jgi:signal transduction histidine kinase